jgi:hypothetical protein
MTERRIHTVDSPIVLAFKRACTHNMNSIHVAVGSCPPPPRFRRSLGGSSCSTNVLLELLEEFLAWVTDDKVLPLTCEGGALNCLALEGGDLVRAYCRYVVECDIPLRFGGLKLRR